MPLTRSRNVAALTPEVEAGGGIALYQPGDVFGPARFDDYEMVWIMQGDVWWEVDGRRRHAPPGTICLMKPGTVQTFHWDKKGQSRHAYFIFSFLRGRELFPPDEQMPEMRTLRDNQVLKPLFQHILWLMAERAQTHKRQLSMAVQLFLEAFISGAMQADEDAGMDWPAAVVEALLYARKKWEGGILSLPSLAELCRHTHVSRAQLYRHFMKTLGMGPLTAIRLIRLEEASLQLIRSDRRIKEIAEATGFSNPYHFSQAFKDLYGVSPRAFRSSFIHGTPLRPIPKLVQVRQMKRVMIEG